MNMLNLFVIIAAIACTYLGQSRRVPYSIKRECLLLGALACTGATIDALGRGENSTAALFAVAGLLNAALAITGYFKPSSPDA